MAIKTHDPSGRDLLVGDNIHWLRRIPDGCVQTVYIDPPFAKNQTFVGGKGMERLVEGIAAGEGLYDRLSTEGRKAVEAAASRFKERVPVQSFDDHWLWDAWCDEWLDRLPDKLALYIRSVYASHPSMAAYLVYMAPRVIEMRRVLSDTGSFFYHCDPTANSYVRVMLDIVFGRTHMVNEIVWCYAGGGVPKTAWPRKHDTIFCYRKGEEMQFEHERRPYGAHNTTGRRATDNDGTRKVEYNPEGTPVNDWWPDVQPVINWSSERTGYATQKPLALLDRIIKATTNEGDLVLDAFCGCATACVSAERLGRRWVGIDIDPIAEAVTLSRLVGDHIRDIKVRVDKEDKLTKDEMQSLYLRQGRQCAITHQTRPLSELTRDHVLARSEGGSDSIENSQLVTANANSKKGARAPTKQGQLC